MEVWQLNLPNAVLLERLKGDGDQFAAPPIVSLDWFNYWQDELKL